MLLGFVLVAAGIGLAFRWPQEFFFAVKGGLILGLMLLGLINVLIGISRQKAKRSFARALHDDPGEEKSQSPAGDSSPSSAPQT